MNFSYLKKGWKEPIILRTEVGKFSRGIISPGYIANLDGIGQGPKRMKIAGKVAYKVTDFINWLESRTEVL